MATIRFWIGSAESLGFTKSVMPNSRATSSFSELTSMPMIRVAPANFAACTTLNPTAPASQLVCEAMYGSQLCVTATCATIFAPKPKTATEEPGSTFVVLKTAPRPVLSTRRLHRGGIHAQRVVAKITYDTPHPKRAALYSGMAGLIFAHDISARTVYSENVLQPMKW